VQQLWLCTTCITQLENPTAANEKSLENLNVTIWSELPVVKIAPWRMLHKFKQFAWIQYLKDMAYLYEE
jgi:protein PhnA